VKISVRKGRLVDAKSEAVILSLLEGEKKLSGEALAIDKKSGGLISDFLKHGDFEGKPSQVSVIYNRGKALSKRIALVGLGKPEDVNLERIRSAFSAVLRHLSKINVRKATAAIDLSLKAGAKDEIAQAAVEGALLGLYQFTPYKTVSRDEFKRMDELIIFATTKDYALVQEAAKTARIIAEAVYLARDLANTPANEMTPSILARKAQTVARKRKLSCRVLNRAAMKKIGMNALLAVASGSNEEPKLIILEYRGGAKKTAPLVLVGKGLTFDSGGISLKPAEKMDEMKMDMAGGAAVIAALQAAADLRLPIHLVGLIPATENLPDGRAYKPGDIIRSYSGKTIEVLNTDAEGRLVLADTLAYAARLKPAALVDAATLTGACVIALGEEVIGMLGTDEQLKQDIRKAADKTGERVWELPLWENYHEQIKSDIADYKNTGGRPAGTITAAAFLSKFVGDFPWVHLDIAGPAWTTKDKAYIPKGASGVPVRLLVEFLRGRAKQ